MLVNLRKKVKAYYVDLVQGKRKGALDAFFSFFLLCCSFVYGFLVKLVLACYQTGVCKTYQSPVRVISVGNLTWGGTGKTPLVETLARFFKDEGKNPAILIRGYGKDEVAMLKSKFKEICVLAGRDRVRTAKSALKHCSADIIILDDGFQHWRLGRDLDIVLIDCKTPFGNRRLIPRGILREPLSSLTRADVFILTKSELAGENTGPIKQELRKYNPRAAIYEAVHTPRSLYRLTTKEGVEFSTIKDRPVALLAGIASPSSFVQTVSSLGAKVALRFDFPDHYRYGRKDLQKIAGQAAERQIETLITTEKDAAKLSGLFRPGEFTLEILVLGVELEINRGKEEFFNLLRKGKDAEQTYHILVLNDGKAGHLNQSKAVAGIIRKRKTDSGMNREDVSIRTVEVRFKNGLCRILLGLCAIFASQRCAGCLACLRFCLSKDSYEELIQLPANVVVSAGSSLSSVNLFLAYRNRARKVVLMKPSFLILNRFDLVVVPEHDRLEVRNNVLLTRITPNLIEREYLQDQAGILQSRIRNKGFRFKPDSPTIGVLIGGDTATYRMSRELVNKIIIQLKAVARNLNCRLLITTSRRTPRTVAELLKENLNHLEQCQLLVIANEKNIPEAVGGILGLGDIILVSGESISMVSEAVSAEKYVLVFMPEKRLKAQTKQERFLQKLEQDKMVKVVLPDRLSEEIETLWQARPGIIKAQHRQAIYQAISKIL